MRPIDRTCKIVIQYRGTLHKKNIYKAWQSIVTI